jgi:hypothetical protein
LLAAPLIVAAAGGSAAASVLVAVDKSAQEMSVSVDGTQKYKWPVSTGRPGYSTPSGKYTPFRMEEDHFSEEWDDAPMPNSIFFTMKGHAIHGTLDARHLGGAASHGCVRISVANAKTLYALVKREGLANTTVVVEGNERSAPLVAKRKDVAPDAAAVAARAAESRPLGDQPAAPQSQYRQSYGSDGYAYSGNEREAAVVERDFYGRIIIRRQVPPRDPYFERGSVQTYPRRYQEPAQQYYRQYDFYD